MERLIVDPSLRDRLAGLDSDLELCDEQGRTLGYFTPAAGDQRPYDWAKAQFTDEELDQARREPGGRTTAEVLARLGRS